MKESSSTLIRHLADVAEVERSQVGGKAQSLGVLAAAGFAVPAGVVLTTGALEAFLVHTGLQARREAFEAGLTKGQVPSEADLAAFREAIEAQVWPDELSATVVAELRRVFPEEQTPVAVRSSGTREDLEGASFAGQYETFLNVRGYPAILENVKRCWASLWESRVLEYAINRGGGGAGLSMSVVVQALVDAEVAGVLFTVNPVTGRENEVLIEAVHGLGEALVSGRVSADQFILDAYDHSVIQSTPARQAFKIVSTEQGTEEVELDEEAGTALTLNAERLNELADLSADIQEHYGRPMDVEFAYAGGKLAVLQARPITSLSFAPDLGEWTTADFRDGGVASDVCSPFMWSLYDYALEQSMPGYFKSIKLVARDHEATWGRMFFARPYWNLGEVKRALEPVPGYDEAALHADLGVDVEEGFQGKKTPTTLMGILRALPVLFALNKSYKDRLAYNEAFVASFAERKRPFDIRPEEVAALGDATFLERLRELLTGLYRDTETGYFYTIYNTSNSKLDLKPAFEAVNALAGGGLDEPTLLSGLKDLSHLRSMKHLHRLAGELVASGEPLTDEIVADFAWTWRHHGRKELDIRVPRWVDDPDFVRNMLQSAIDTYNPDFDPEAMEEKHHQHYLNARERALAAVGWRFWLRRSFASKLDLVRRYAWWREEMRDHSSYAYYLVRLWSVDAGRRLAQAGVFAEPEDVWYLPFPDLLATLEGELSPEGARQKIRAGRRLVRSFRNFDNPNEIGSHFRAERSTPLSSDSWVGTPCSPGVITATACVVTRLEDANRLEPGQILVTRFTDPGWTPLFARISAVVTETGGVLSHAAVIAREYGVPAVLAVNGITTVIPDGATIRVDGFNGTVELVE